MTPDEIDTLLPETARDEFARRFLHEYLKDGFGAATKRATELLIFHLLEELGPLDKKDNNSASHKLQITETRIKAYRYESKLRFAPTEEKYVERRILWALARSEFDANNKRIKFIVEDPYLRKTLNARSKRLGGVPDSSFNSEIVTLRADQLIALINHLYGEGIADSYKKDFDKLLAEDSKIKFAEIRKKMVLGAAGALGGGVVKAIKAYFVADPT